MASSTRADVELIGQPPINNFFLVPQEELSDSDSASDDSAASDSE